MSIWQFLRTGGFTIYILLACSFISIIIIVERFLYYRLRSRARREDFMATLRDELKKGHVKQCIDFCTEIATPFANVAKAGLNFFGHDEKIISGNMEREIVVETTTLERFTSVVGTIGSVAVYIGLFGTVLGIIRAFRDIATSGSGGINVVISGISEALVCTAAGLCVAVPAVVAYNYFIRRTDNFIKDMELCASEVMEIIQGAQNDDAIATKDTGSRPKPGFFK